jgi:hypothetical protein
MHKRWGLVLALTLGTAAGALAQQFDEMQARAACQDDAFRYCQATIPDRDRTLACLLQNRNNLSGACRTVLAEFFPPDPPAKRKGGGTTQQRAKGGPIDLNPAANR